MPHWSERYLGLSYAPGNFDCADLAVKVQREVFGREVVLPSDHGSDPFGRNARIEAHKLACAEPVDEPADGDAVLLITNGRLQHIGLLCLIRGERWVLHNRKALGVTRGRLRDLEAQGYRVEGFYAWR